MFTYKMKGLVWSSSIQNRLPAPVHWVMRVAPGWLSVTLCVCVCVCVWFQKWRCEKGNIWFKLYEVECSSQMLSIKRQRWKWDKLTGRCLLNWQTFNKCCIRIQLIFCMSLFSVILLVLVDIHSVFRLLGLSVSGIMKQTNLSVEKIFRSPEKKTQVISLYLVKSTKNVHLVYL